ncbi:MAG: anti-sigma factor, partial [Chitinophagales bacterium]|nr:anti-sigma factor [Chitinophagales bacterium]
MNTQEYIQSGTLDLYTAGLLSIEEMRDVELNACIYPEIKTELLSIQSSFENYAQKYSISPPDWMKERILNAIEGNIESPSVTSSSKVVAMKPAIKNNSMLWLAAASVALLLVVGGIALNLSSQISGFKNQVAQLQNDLKGNEEALNTNQQQLAILADANTVRVSMKGTAKSPESLAMIYWNKNTKAVYLDIKNLPVAPAGKQYQLWFIDTSNKPVSAGVFDSKIGMLQMTNANDALAFAVTLEPMGGSVNPTMDEMYV